MRNVNSMCRWIGGVVAVLTMCGAPAMAQQDAAVATKSRFNVDVGDVVWVTTVDGRTTKGRVSGVRPDGLELFGDNRRTVIAGKNVRKVAIEYTDPLHDGVLRGLAIGAGGGALVGLIPEHCPGGCIGGKRLAIGAPAIFGAGIGVIADALVHAKRVVYESKTAMLNLEPIVEPHGGGAVIAIRW